MQLPIYLDNHATTRVDPRVVEAMLPFFSHAFGNAGSTTHAFGWDAKRAVDEARETVAAAIGAQAKEIVFTSGATESNNLAVRGALEQTKKRGRHIVSVAAEHPSVLDPLARLRGEGFDVTLLPVIQAPDPQAGRIVVEQLEAALRDDTILVSVMAANNEIGAVQPLAEIGRICKTRGVLFHTDATQGVGRIPVDVQRLQVDLLSLTAHKIYGPKGVGALYVRSKSPRVRLQPLLEGGGQEGGLRSGTLNVPGIVGLARTVQLCVDELDQEPDREGGTAALGCADSPGTAEGGCATQRLREPERLRRLRDRLFASLCDGLPGVTLNGPALSNPEWRLPGNLNVSIADVDGQSLLMSMKEVALSSGSACSSEHPEPSHVLRGLGIGDASARSSIRVGLGRFNTSEEVDFAAQTIIAAVRRLRAMAAPP